MSGKKTWHVSGSVAAGTFVGDFEAESAEDAFEQAWREASVGVCHHCADNISDPEVVDLVAYTDDGEEATTEIRIDHRAQRIRDIVAQQWAVAAALICGGGGVYDDEDIAEKLPDGRPFVGWRLSSFEVVVLALAALPSAAEIVGGEP